MQMSGVPNGFDRIYDACLTLLYPQACVLCGASVERRTDAPACATCWKQTELFSISDAMCWKCGAPAAGGAGVGSPREIACRSCDAAAWTAARAVGLYAGALKATVLELKHKHFVSDKIIELLSGWRKQSPFDQATLIVPVPLHLRRERERGFNQAALVARRLARREHLPFDDASLVRTKYAEEHRSAMDAEARRASVAGAFDVVRPRLIEGESVLLVDDVWTTGATASACAAPLRAAGAREVFVLTIARA